ncbi:MAG: hypothetical protein OXQ31_26265 [Spirochaetaceae bacterium]|nr:hypothetical protein [Spirochaetaceae bacterium]
MITPTGEGLRQRADYTHKFNASTGRHGWLRLTPAYSVKIVEELLSQYKGRLRVLDPFSGTGTTVLSAAYHGHTGVTTDINPFLVWLGETKIARYSDSSIAAALAACEQVVDIVERNSVDPAPPPSIHNIDRWWSREALAFLCALKASIGVATKAESPQRRLLLVAFCRTLIKLSNAAFNHQSMSFKGEEQLELRLSVNLKHVFEEEVNFVAVGAQENPKGAGEVVYGDARRLEDAVDGTFDLVVTSPPYANRMSYIRELRPYMYWLGFLANGRDAGELDWASIGGTWGVATSRLADWRRPSVKFDSDQIHGVLDRIGHHSNKSGEVLAKYIAKYLDDMWAHFDSLTSVLGRGSKIHYIVGNSTFYGILVPVEQLYVLMLERLGFEEIQCRPIRKRNSKKELFEFDVSARWEGRLRARRD